MAHAGERVWRLGPGREASLGRPCIMGILNVTPDSFSDGGAYENHEDAAAAAIALARAGAAVIDIGGESTRPGSRRVAVEEQIRRAVPVIRAIRAVSRVLITIDTTRAEVAAAALDAGADAINDVSAGMEDGEMMGLAASRDVGIVLMHRLRPPGSDVYSNKYVSAPEYAGGVVESVKRFLGERAEAALRAGGRREGIVLDPGLGFGKSVGQNLELIERTGEIAALGYPVLSGLSRKSFTAVVGGVAADAPMSERVRPTLELSVRHRRAGASIFRVHDVGEHARALRS